MTDGNNLDISSILIATFVQQCSQQFNCGMHPIEDPSGQINAVFCEDGFAYLSPEPPDEPFLPKFDRTVHIDSSQNESTKNTMKNNQKSSKKQEKIEIENENETLDIEDNINALLNKASTNHKEENNDELNEHYREETNIETTINCEEDPSNEAILNHGEEASNEVTINHEEETINEINAYHDEETKNELNTNHEEAATNELATNQDETDNKLNIIQTNVINDMLGLNQETEHKGEENSNQEKSNQFEETKNDGKVNDEEVFLEIPIKNKTNEDETLNRNDEIKDDEMLNQKNDFLDTDIQNKEEEEKEVKSLRHENGQEKEELEQKEIDKENDENEGIEEEEQNNDNPEEELEDEDIKNLRALTDELKSLTEKVADIRINKFGLDWGLKKGQPPYLINCDYSTFVFSDDLMPFSMYFNQILLFIGYESALTVTTGKCITPNRKCIGSQLSVNRQKFEVVQIQKYFQPILKSNTKNNYNDFDEINPNDAYSCTTANATSLSTEAADKLIQYIIKRLCYLFPQMMMSSVPCCSHCFRVYSRISKSSPTKSTKEAKKPINPLGTRRNNFSQYRSTTSNYSNSDRQSSCYATSHSTYSTRAVERGKQTLMMTSSNRNQRMSKTYQKGNKKPSIVPATMFEPFQKTQSGLTVVQNISQETFKKSYSIYSRDPFPAFIQHT